MPFCAACLPAAGLTRAQPAAQTLGNAHALDAGQPVASLVLAAWRYAEAAAEPSPQDEPSDLEKEREEAVDDEIGAPRLAPERSRDIWARAGILVNELARPALMLNLPVAMMNPSANSDATVAVADLIAPAQQRRSLRAQYLQPLSLLAGRHLSS